MRAVDDGTRDACDIESMNASLRLHLVRHGETAWSLSGQHTGRTDVLLTAHGEEQARQLAAYMAGPAFSHVFVSPRQRARRTCELLTLGVPAEIDPDLAEWDYGAYEGRRTVDIRKENPDWDLWTQGCPDGEMPADVAARADRLIARLLPLQGNIALVSHGHFGCALAVRWLGFPIDAGRHFVLDPASLGILDFAPRQHDVRAMSLWNASADAGRR
jgi:broad specificity phosphatase PhoE